MGWQILGESGVTQMLQAGPRLVDGGPPAPPDSPTGQVPGTVALALDAAASRLRAVGRLGTLPRTVRTAVAELRVRIRAEGGSLLAQPSRRAAPVDDQRDGRPCGGASGGATR